MSSKFDKSKYYLGTLCKRGHDYEGTGKSLRRNSNGYPCVECQKKSQNNYDKKIYWSKRSDDERLLCASVKSAILLAKEKGEKYYLGYLCKNNHRHKGMDRSLRFASNGACTECSRNWSRDHRSKHRDDVNSRQRLHYHNNKETILARAKIYYHENFDSISAKRKIYAEQNREFLREQHRRWCKENAGHLKSVRANYRRGNVEKFREINRRYYKKNCDRIKIRVKKWVKENRDKVRRTGMRHWLRHNHWKEAMLMIESIEDEEEKEYWKSVIDASIEEHLLIYDLKKEARLTGKE